MHEWYKELQARLVSFLYKTVLQSVDPLVWRLLFCTRDKSCNCVNKENIIGLITAATCTLNVHQK